MKKQFKKIGLTLYEKKLKNGLRVYIVPKDNINDIYATLTADYGSVDTSFKVDGEVKKTPDGIAHFLEHKMFEQKDGKDPFQIFDENGASANALTSNYKTTYLFSGPNHVKENLKTLLNFVQEPYFTDENVEKEKGIIIQEVKMGEDQPQRIGYAKALENAFCKHPIRKMVIGDIKSINSITKEDLYECYNAFYQPSNMFLVITGNVNPIKTIEFIEKNQSKKQFKEKKIEKLTYHEPDTVYKKKEIIKMNVSIDKLYYSFKINISSIDIEKRLIIKYLSIYIDCLFGDVSAFEEEIEKEKLCDFGVDFIISKTDKHLLLTFIAETNKPSKVIKKIDKYIGKDINLDDFNRKKKLFLSSSIFMSDSIYKINSKIINDVLDSGKVITDIYEENANLKFEILNNILSKIDFKNRCEVLVQSNKT